MLSGRGVLSHNAALPGQVTGWKELGENVGVGGTVDAVHDGFMASPTHQANLIEAGFTRVGFGIVRPDARIFVVEVFMRPTSGTTAAPSAAAAPAPAAAKAPAAVSPATGAGAAASPVRAPAATTPQGAGSALSPSVASGVDVVRSMLLQVV